MAAAEPVRRASTIPNEPGSGRGKCPVVRWRDVGQEGVMAFMAPLLAENRPFLMSGYWTHQVLCKDAAQRWRTFAGIKSVLAGHGLNELRVDVSCTKKGHSFRGDQANRQHVSLRLMDMVELAEANETGQPHWAAAEEVGLDYFLCQCPVVSREVGKPEVLSAIAGEFRTPSCVLEEDLLQINLWLGAMETTTNMHYDANHNLLFVLKGSKRVALLPPDMIGGVHAMPVFSESANHCGLRHEDAAGVAGSAEGMRKGAVYADVAEGEALFIPEGWWHQITSSRGTVAANVWFKVMFVHGCRGPMRRAVRTRSGLIRAGLRASTANESMPHGRRKPTRQTSLHKRPGALHAKSIVELRHLERCLVSFMLMSDCKPTRCLEEG
eukprot:jgi/Undpi1/1149/HiC_scaffold_10.g04611.m1